MISQVRHVINDIPAETGHDTLEMSCMIILERQIVENNPGQTSCRL